MKHKLILIPDVHGRRFWKDAIPFIEAGVPAVFLGDYSDPYPAEKISSKEAVENLADIIGVARAYSDRVTLLLGNHDLSYFGMEKGLWSVSADRYSRHWSKRWHNLFWDNVDLFSICKQIRVGGHKYLLSHAGIHPEWVDSVFLFDKIDKSSLALVAAKMEELFRQSLNSTTRTAFIESLAVVGYMRGGISPAGSPVWADCHEYEFVEYDGISQIFGHSQQFSFEETDAGFVEVPAKTFVCGNNYCIDCRRCFFLDGNGQLRYLDSQEKVISNC